MITSCQHRADVKALTGRGALRRLRDARSNVDSLHREMHELVKLTLAVPGRTMYLCLHQRSRTGQVALRWRQAGALAPHLSWGGVEKLLQGYPRQLALWYRRVNETARRLNASEKQARAALKAARWDVNSTQIDLEGA